MSVYIISPPLLLFHADLLLREAQTLAGWATLSVQGILPREVDLF